MSIFIQFASSYLYETSFSELVVNVTKYRSQFDTEENLLTAYDFQYGFKYKSNQDSFVLMYLKQISHNVNNFKIVFFI